VLWQGEAGSGIACTRQQSRRAMLLAIWLMVMPSAVSAHTNRLPSSSFQPAPVVTMREKEAVRGAVRVQKAGIGVITEMTGMTSAGAEVAGWQGSRRREGRQK